MDSQYFKLKSLYIKRRGKRQNAMTPPIEASPLHVRRDENDAPAHRLVCSAASLRGGVPSLLCGTDGGDVVATIVHRPPRNDGRDGRDADVGRRLVVERMDGAIVASFDLPPRPATPDASSLRGEREEGGCGYPDPVLCWASFRNDDDRGSDGIGIGMPGGRSGRKMLCALGNPNTLLVFDVLGDAALLSTDGDASGTEVDDGGGPGGHTVPLPFGARAIHPNADGEGLLISRMPSEEDYAANVVEECAQNNTTFAGKTSGKGGAMRSMPPLPPPTPTGFSLPATPRSLHRPSHSNGAGAGVHRSGGAIVLHDDEELSLEGPPEPVRFPGGDGSFHPGFEKAFDRGPRRDEAEAASVPCLFSLRHPLDEIRPLAVGTRDDRDEGSTRDDDDELFSNVAETLVRVASPRLFGSPGDEACPVCVTRDESSGRHAVWSLERAARPAPAPPLWRTAGRGAWRSEGARGGTDGDERARDVASRESRDRRPVKRDIFSPADDEASADRSRDDSNEGIDDAGGVPSSFSDIHPDFTLTKLFEEDVPAVVAPAAENPAADDEDDDAGNPGARVARRVFLATDALGRGDLVLCILAPRGGTDGTEGGEGHPTREPAMLRCFALHPSDEDSDEQSEREGGREEKVAVRSVSHLVDLPCAAAQPMRCAPIPLAPFAASDRTGGDGDGRRRSTGRFSSTEEDSMAIDILVLRQPKLQQCGEDHSPEENPMYELGLFRGGGTIHAADFALPAATLEGFHPSSRPVALANAVGNRVDIQFAEREGHPPVTTTVRASFSLLMDASPVTEAALRAVESALVHERGVADLPCLIRADCVRLFRRTASPDDGDGGRVREGTSPGVEDDGWRSLTVVLLGLLGMEEGEGPSREKPKKPSAWEALLRSDFHSAFSRGEGGMLFCDEFDDLEDFSVDSGALADDPVGGGRDDRDGVLSSVQCIAKLGTVGSAERSSNSMDPHNSCRQTIFDSLHLLHEDSRLASQSRGGAWTRRLGTFLLHVVEQMGPCMADFEDHYRRNLGGAPRCSSNVCRSYSMPSEERRRLTKFAVCPCIMTCLDDILQQDDGSDGDFGAEYASYETSVYKDLVESAGLNGVCSHTWTVVCLFSILFDQNNTMPMQLASKREDMSDDEGLAQRHRDRAAILAMLDEGIFHSMQLQDELPMGVSLPLLEAVRRCRLDPPQVGSTSDCWPPAAFDLVGRNDLAEFLSRSQRESPHGGPANDVDDASSEDPDNDGLVALEDYSSMVFPDDNRVREAARLLRSSRPVFLRVPRPVELSDHDYERSKQERLLLLCRRSIALSLGRGALTLGTHSVPSAEQLLVPNIVLAGRVPPANGTLALDMASCPANFRVWPEFHNGVAAGLRLPRNRASGAEGQNGRTITRTWIKFNKPVTTAQDSGPGGNNGSGQTPPPSYAHGGFLMALGLRGYLSALTT